MLLDKNPARRPDAASLLNFTEIRASVMKVMDMAAKEMTDDKAIIQAYVDINSHLADKSIASEVQAKGNKQ
jgi:uridylate kinase